ncbi:hypothetical protein [Microvirga solisilvae]|uniref:hypothetical protein n=1 Tax=Microvirga solisilvae TaxID=2919498 RepID=UPI001FAF69B6|nr:hypothetical protein [Microvirga solisilvae]
MRNASRNLLTIQLAENGTLSRIVDMSAAEIELVIFVDRHRASRLRLSSALFE